MPLMKLPCNDSSKSRRYILKGGPFDGYVYHIADNAKDIQIPLLDDPFKQEPRYPGSPGKCAVYVKDGEEFVYSLCAECLST